MNRMLGSVTAGVAGKTSSCRRRFQHPLSATIRITGTMILNSGCWARKGFTTATTNNIPLSEETISVDDENGSNKKKKETMAMLKLEEVEEILRDVRADDVRVIPISPPSSSSSSSSSSTPIHLPSSDSSQSSWMDYMVVATGRSPWHVRNIAQALIHRVKEKRKGAKHIVLPRVHGYQGGKWVVVDSGNVVIHALDEKARTYYNLEDLYAKRASNKISQEDLHLLLEQPKEEVPRC